MERRWDACQALLPGRVPQPGRLHPPLPPSKPCPFFGPNQHPHPHAFHCPPTAVNIQTSTDSLCHRSCNPINLPRCPSLSTQRPTVPTSSIDIGNLDLAKYRSQTLGIFSTVPLLKKLRRSSRGNIIQSSFADIASESHVYPMSNGFVGTIVEAYNQHHHLELRPDDVWFALLSQINIHVKMNCEK